MTDAEITHLRAVGALLAAIRVPGEQSVIVSFAARDFDSDTGDSSVGVTVTKGGMDATAHAAGTDLATALMLARAGCDRAIEAKAKKAATLSEQSA